MPSRTIRVTISAEKINERLVVHTGATEKIREGAKITLEHREEGDFWVIELPVAADDGFFTEEVIEYNKKEVDEILFQEARTRNKIDITGGGQHIRYEYDSSVEEPFPLKRVILEFTGKFK